MPLTTATPPTQEESGADPDHTARERGRTLGVRRDGQVRRSTPDAQPASFAKWAQAYVDHDVMAAVGHEPHLGTLVTWLLSGRADSHVVLKKGDACLVECDGAPGPATGRLHWLHTPAMLRRMAE